MAVKKKKVERKKKIVKKKKVEKSLTDFETELKQLAESYTPDNILTFQRIKEISKETGIAFTKIEQIVKTKYKKNQEKNKTKNKKQKTKEKSLIDYETELKQLAEIYTPINTAVIQRIKEISEETKLPFTKIEKIIGTRYKEKQEKIKLKKKSKEKKEFRIKEEIDISYLLDGEKKVNDELIEFQKEVLTNLALKKPRKATELIVQKILSEKKIYTIRDDEKTEMWIYNEGIYIPQAKTFIKEFSRLVLGKTYNSHLGNEIIAKIEVDTYIDSKEFFNNINLEEIAVENGILNIFTKKLRPFNQRDIFFNKIPITYNPKAKCPAIETHFKTVLKNEEDVPVIEELFGYLLFKEYRIEKAFMMCGSGRNGKGKTLELMKRFLGVENCANIPIQQFESDPYSVGELFNKMANLSGDIDKRALKHTGIFKNLTGRDLISANRKFLPRVNFVNFAKLIFCSNELPITYDLTPAFWNRWVTLEFPYTFVSQKEYNKLEEQEKKDYKIADPDIIDKIATPEELSGLLNVALEGLKRLMKQKDFSYSKSVAEVKDFWIRKSNSLMAFCMDCIEEDYDGKITKQEFRKGYSTYCRNNRISMQGDKAIKYFLTTNYAVGEERDQTGGKQISYWAGIKYKNGMGGMDGN